MWILRLVVFTRECWLQCIICIWSLLSFISRLFDLVSIVGCYKDQIHLRHVFSFTAKSVPTLSWICCSSVYLLSLCHPSTHPPKRKKYNWENEICLLFLLYVGCMWCAYLGNFRRARCGTSSIIFNMLQYSQGTGFHGLFLVRLLFIRRELYRKPWPILRLLFVTRSYILDQIKPWSKS